MVTLKDDQIILRDFKDSDIEKRIYWETTETEWQLWDAPWETESLTEIEKKKELEDYIENMKGWAEKFHTMPDTQRRYGFQICTCEDNYIGWCNSYYIDEEYNYSKSGTKCTIGIDIPEIYQRGKGYAFHALCLFIDYLLKHGEDEIYTQTWSGNKRMIHLAQKLGFEECCRKSEIRKVRGKVYDGLTFRLNMNSYQSVKYMKRS